MTPSLKALIEKTEKEFDRVWVTKGTEVLEKLGSLLKNKLSSAQLSAYNLGREDGVENERILLAQKLHRIIEKGAPSEQESPIRYGAEIWNKVHELRDILLSKESQTKE